METTLNNVTQVEDLLYGLAARAREALERRLRQPAPPIPRVAPADLPDVPVVHGVTFGGLRAGQSTCGLIYASTLGSVADWIARDLTPSQILEVADALEAWTAQVEELADQHEVAVEAATVAALDAEEPAIREIARRVAHLRQYDGERADWIAEHGSERLRRLVAEGIEHDAVYRDERLAVDRPGWDWLADSDWGEASLAEPRNASEAALRLLDRARKSDPAAHLQYFVLQQDDDTTDRGYVVVTEFLGRDIVWNDDVAA